MDNSMNPYQKFVIFLGSSILIGVFYFVYRDITVNFQSKSSANSFKSLNFNKNKNADAFEKVLGSYVTKKDDDSFEKKIEFKKDGSVFLSRIETIEDSISTDYVEKAGTWFLDNNNVINIDFINPNQKIKFNRGENDSIYISSSSDQYENTETSIFTKE